MGHTTQTHPKTISVSLSQRHCLQTNSSLPIFEYQCQYKLQQTTYIIFQIIKVSIINTNIKIKIKIKMKMKAIVYLMIGFVYLIQSVMAYIEIELQITTVDDLVMYSIPAKINGINYHMVVSMENKQEYIVPIIVKAPKKNKKKYKNVKELTCQIQAMSMQNYSFQGWLRFIRHAIMFIEGHYKHTLSFPISSVPQLSTQSTTYPHDALLTLGPNLQSNQIYKLIKESTPLITNQVISIYKKTDGKSALMQLGGIEQNFAKIGDNGVRFYQFELDIQDDKWKIPIMGVQCLRMGGSTEKYEYTVPQSSMSMTLSLQRRGIRLPMSISEDIIKNFQTAQSQCKLSPSHKLTCTQIPQSLLTFYSLTLRTTPTSSFQFQLSDLILSHNPTTKQTQFSIQFTNQNEDIEIGQILFHNYYVSIDVKNKLMKYSSINYYTKKQVEGVHVVRFGIGVMVLCVVVAVVARIWGGFTHRHQEGEGKGSYNQLRVLEEGQ